MVVKMLAKAYAKEGMSKEEFTNYWLTKHAPMAKQALGPALKKYVINIVMSTDGEEPGYQGTAELWFDNLANLQSAMSSPAGKQGLADVANFARKITSMIVEEHTIV
jgi:uncharacterized protein (TIGR02118 family)